MNFLFQYYVRKRNVILTLPIHCAIIKWYYVIFDSTLSKTIHDDGENEDMRKLLTLLLTVTMLATLFVGWGTITASAASTGELLVNPGFEDGEENWESYSQCTMEIADDVTHSGDGAMLLTERSAPWGVYRQRLEDVLTVNGPGEYTFSAWVRLAEGEETGPCMVVITLTGDTSAQTWATSATVQLTQEWQQLKISQKTLTWGGEIKDAGIYVQTGSADYKPDIYVDDFSLVKESAVNGKPIPTAVPKPDPIAGDETKRGEKTTIGAIRWDAWYGEPRSGDGTSVVEQVEKTLSPAKYHFRVPFYGTITADNKVLFPEYTQATMDTELQMAADAGIDYWAYVWYDTDMGKVRKLHATSQYKDKVKMCSIFDGNAIGKQYARDELKTLLVSGIWQTVQGGRPLMYYFYGTDQKAAITEDIAYYRALCTELNISAPYAVLMGGDAQAVKDCVADAGSAYAIGGSNGIPFSQLAASAERSWTSAAANGRQLIPTVTTGWHNGPRADNPVAWTSPDSSSWVEYAEPEEIAGLLWKALQWTDAHPKLNMANTVIMYAWNENDEGGWIAPTLAVDEEGNALKNADNTYKMDRTRLDAVKGVITSYKTSGLANAPTATPGPTPGATRVRDTETPAATVAPKDGLGTGVIIGIIAAAVVVLGGGAVFLRLKKKGSVPKDEPKE